MTVAMVTTIAVVTAHLRKVMIRVMTMMLSMYYLNVGPFLRILDMHGRRRPTESFWGPATATDWL